MPVSIIDNFLKKRQINEEAEMSFIDHLEELRWHIIRSVIAILVAGIIMWLNIDWVFQNIILGPANSDFISYRALCSLGELIHVDVLCLGDMNIRFQNTELSGQFMMSFSVSFMLGFIVSFPYIFWQFWKFIKPALREDELKYARGIVFWSSTLFFLGVLFAYFLIAPFTINFFATYKLAPQFENIFTMSNYYDTMSDLILGLGIVFELPVVVYFLSRLGILSPALMRTQRKYATLIIFVLAAVITPPDWFSIWLVALPLLGLYEVGIRISQRAVKERQRKDLLQQNK